MTDSTTRTIFSRGLTDGEHQRRLDVERSPEEGWRVREQRDTQVVRQVTYEDWHRVELVIRGFSAEAVQLKQQGWQED